MRLVKITDDDYVNIDTVVAVTVTVDKFGKPTKDKTEYLYRVVVEYHKGQICVADDLTHVQAQGLLERTVERINRIAHCGEED